MTFEGVINMGKLNISKPAANLSEIRNRNLCFDFGYIFSISSLTHDTSNNLLYLFHFHTLHCNSHYFRGRQPYPVVAGQPQTLQGMAVVLIFHQQFRSFCFLWCWQYLEFMSFNQINSWFSQFMTKAQNMTSCTFIAQRSFSYVDRNKYCNTRSCKEGKLIKHNTTRRAIQLA